MVGWTESPTKPSRAAGLNAIAGFRAVRWSREARGPWLTPARPYAELVERKGGGSGQQELEEQSHAAR